MITPEFVQTMARYNVWQNGQMLTALERLSPDALTMDRGAFFGSILGTANHILWGDAIWMTRFDGGPRLPGAIADSPMLFPTLADWSAERSRMDARITDWAAALRAPQLAGPHRWHSALLGRDVEKPMGLIVAHMFNHQTHHRGQIHAMLTAAGVAAPVSDMFLMPE
jgi:uncharacterized damage-inducible protein DinB